MDTPPNDPSRSQVLLSRVLIEEYEALAQPKSNDARFSAFKNAKGDGDTVKKIYKLINTAQRERVSEIRADYEEQFKPWIDDDAARNQVVSQAMLADISGEIDDLENEVTAEINKKFPDVKEGERLKSLVENGLINRLSERAKNGAAPVND